MSPFSLLLFLPFIFLLHHLYRRLRYRLPPGPRPRPVVGNLYDIKPARFRCYAEWAQHYGPIISVWMGSTLNVVVSNTELAKEVLKEKDQQLADRHRNRSPARFSKDGQDLIWADYGPHYVKVRKVCTIELFSIMPCLLAHLIINKCHRLRTLPHRLLRKVSSLKTLDITGSTKLQICYGNKERFHRKSISLNNHVLQLIIQY